MRPLALAALVVALVGSLASFGVAVAQEAEPLGPAPPAAPAGAEDETEPEQQLPRVPYTVEVRGVEDEELRGLLEAVSEARAMADRPPASVVALRRRAQADIPRLLQALRSRGFYDAEVRADVDPAREPALVALNVQPGPVYRFRDIRVETVPPDSDFVPPSPAELGLRSGEPAAARPILDAETELLGIAQQRGYAVARIGDRTAAIERGANAMDLTLRIEPGGLARLGQIDVTGLDEVHESFVRRRLQLETGEVYDPNLLAEARERLVETGLFASVRVRLAEELRPGGRLPVAFEVTERPHRSIGVGVRYRTDEGPGANVSWEHRNFFGRGERVRVEADASGFGTTVDSSFLLGASFRKPDVFDLNTDLVAEAGISQAETEAYDTESIGVQVGLERLLAPGMEAGLGVAFRSVTSTIAGEADTFGLVSLPASFAWDTSDDLLDPSRGGRLVVTGAPFVDTFGSGVAFGKALVRYARYYQVLDEPRLILAGRTAVGTLFGAGRDDVPADERFYAGGGGSIRGFGYQLVSPLDEDGNPLGGRSLLELTGEVRGRITETIGAVAFLDAGGAFESSFPDFEENLRFGTGVGLRYFTPIGPLRLDVAVPLNRRDIDDAFQFYISIGQAF